MIFNTFKNINLIIPELFLGTSILVLILYGSAILTKKKKNPPFIYSVYTKFSNFNFVIRNYVFV